MDDSDQYFIVNEEYDTSEDEDDKMMSKRPNTNTSANVNVNVNKNYYTSEEVIISKANIRLTGNMNRVEYAQRPFGCDYCPSRFNYKHAMVAHTRIHTQEKKIECEECGKKYLDMSEYRKHARRHLGLKNEKCDVCGKMFVMKQNLRKHIKLTHGPKLFKCSLCDTEFSCLETLKIHFRRHTGEQPYSCEPCGLKFRHQATLRRHKMLARIHNPDRPIIYSTPLQRKKMKEKNYLKMKEKEDISMNLKCRHCAISFDTCEALKKHSCSKFSLGEIGGIQGVHALILKNIERTIEEKPVCSQCGMYFLSQSELNKHIRLHTGEGNSSQHEREETRQQHEHQGTSPQVEQQEETKNQLKLVHDFHTYGVKIEEIPKTVSKSTAGKTASNTIGIQQIDGNTFHENNNSETTYQTLHIDYLSELAVSGIMLQLANGQNVDVDENNKVFFDDAVHMNTMVGENVIVGENPTVVDARIVRVDSNVPTTQVVSKDFDDVDFDDDDLNPSEVKESIRRNLMMKNKDVKSIRQNSRHLNSPTTTVSRKYDDLKPVPLPHQKSTVGGNNNRKIPDKPELLMCKHCPTGFTSAEQLESHLNSAHTAEERAALKLTPMQQQYIDLERSGELHCFPMGDDLERPWQCPICKKCFKLQQSVKYHIRTHSVDKPYQCKECGHRVREKCDLNKHMKQHLGVREHKCHVCGYAFVFKHALNKHLKLHDASEKHQCEMCNKVFVTKEYLQMHRRCHGEKNHVCGQCGKKFVSISELKYHLKNHIMNKTGERPNICNVCHKGFKFVNDLTEHMQNTHVELKYANNPHKTKVFSCDNCDRHYISQASLEIHRKKCAGPGFQCPTCNHEFKYQRTLDQHIKKDKCAFDRTLKCDKCFRYFKTTKQLEVHSSVHSFSNGTRTKTRHCPNCKKIFKTRKMLLKHVNALDCSSSKVGHFYPQCTYCRKVFSSQKAVNKHMKTVHENENTKNDNNENNDNITISHTNESDIIKQYDNNDTISHSNDINTINDNDNDTIDDKDDHDTVNDTNDNDFVNDNNDTGDNEKVTTFKRQQNSSNDEHCEECLCTYCGIYFIGSASLNRHNKKVHCKVQQQQQDKKTGEYLCEFCGYECRTNPTMYRHLKDKHPVEFKAKKEARIKIVKTRTERLSEDKFEPLVIMCVCKYCGLGCKSRKIMYAHVKSRHPKELNSKQTGKAPQRKVNRGDIVVKAKPKGVLAIDNDKNYEAHVICEYCGEGFPNKKTIHTHVRHKHPDEFKAKKVRRTKNKTMPSIRVINDQAEIIDDKRHHQLQVICKCEYCEFTCTEQNILSVHMENEHTQELGGNRMIIYNVGGEEIQIKTELFSETESGLNSVYVDIIKDDKWELSSEAV